MLRALSICCALAGVGCATLRTDSPTPAHTAVLDEELAALGPSMVAGGVIVLGEVHGTAELPAFTGRVLAAAATRRPVVLALEIPRTEQSVLDAYLSGTGRAGERARVLERPWWRSDYQDGRRSVAMFQLIESARVLRADGAPLSLVAFDTEENPAERDAAMAKRIVEARAAQPDATVVVLVGSLHAARGELERFAGKTWMVGHLERAGVKVLALRAAYERAAPWVCVDGEADHCGPVEFPGRPISTAGVQLSNDNPNYDGVFAVPQLSTSLPVARSDLSEGRAADAEARRAAIAAYEAGDFAGCAARMSQVKAFTATDAYNQACCLARANDRDGAFGALERARRAGLAGVDMAADADLTSLHADPRWAALITAMAASAPSS